MLRILLAHPTLAQELNDAALDLIAGTAPDQGEMLRAVAMAARQVSGESGFAGLAEALRGHGEELDRLLGEVAAETPSELDLARRELAGAIRQTRMKILKAEQDQLAAAGLPDDAARQRYREIAAQLEKLRIAAEKDTER